MALLSGAVIDPYVHDPAVNVVRMVQAVRVEALTCLELCQELPV